VISTLRAADVRPKFDEVICGLPRWMTVATSIPVIDATALMREPMSASCQLP